MKRFILAVFLSISFYFNSQAQVGENYLNVGLDAGITMNEYLVEEFPAGFGGSVKGLLGVGLNGQVTLSGTFLYFPLNSNYILPAGDNISFRAIPAFLGYRFNFDQLFFEPQLGAALHITQNRFAQTSDNLTSTEFGFAAEAGYVFNFIEVGLRYQHTGQSPYHLGLLAFRAAYRIPLAN